MITCKTHVSKHEKELYYFQYTLPQYAINVGTFSFSAEYNDYSIHYSFDTSDSFNVELNTTKLSLGKMNMINFSYPRFSYDSYEYRDGLLSYSNTQTRVQLSEMYYSGRDSYPVDLTGIYNLKKLEIGLLVINPLSTKKWVLPCELYNATTLAEFTNECGDNGVTIFQIGANLTLTDDITITHSIHIKGNGKTIDLNGHGFVINNDVNVTIENLNFINGDNSILQKPNSHLTLTDCTFTNCEASNKFE